VTLGEAKRRLVLDIQAGRKNANGQPLSAADLPSYIYRATNEAGPAVFAAGLRADASGEKARMDAFGKWQNTLAGLKHSKEADGGYAAWNAQFGSAQPVDRGTL